MLGAEPRVQLSPSALDLPQPCPILQDPLSPLQPSLHSTCAPGEAASHPPTTSYKYDFGLNRI